MSKKISLFSLVLLIVAAINSIRNLPAAALFGSSLIFFFLFSSFVFLFPLSLISAEFASRYPEEGGVFPWIRHAFGGKIAFVAVWLQWINTMVWYPTILSFIAGTAAYLIDPSLAQNRGFLIGVILVVFWGLTFLNLFGLHVSARINDVCACIGTLLPMFLLIAFGAIWVFQGHPMQISFHARDLFPTLNNSENWVSLVAIMASYLGIELSGVHVNDVHNPQRNFPKALGISIIILLTTMILGSLSIAVVVAPSEIRLVEGVMQTFTLFFDRIPGVVYVLALLILLGSIGGMINWLLSPAKGLLQAANQGFLPHFFTKRNERGVATAILFTQAILVSLCCFAFTFLPNINAFYWFFTALSTELYSIVYLLLLFAAFKLGRPHRASNAYRIPKGIRTLTCALGCFGCLLTIAISFFPPAGIETGGALRYTSLIALGNIILIAPAGFLCWAQKRQS